jgi:hypothetical protein
VSTVAMGRFVIGVSPDGKNNWRPLKVEEVPEWVKDPKVMGQMADGMLAHREEDGEDAPWYCAVGVPHVAANDPPEYGGIEAGGVAPPIVTPLILPDYTPLRVAEPIVDADGQPISTAEAFPLVGGGGESDAGGASGQYDAAPSSSEPDPPAETGGGDQGGGPDLGGDAA